MGMYANAKKTIDHLNALLEAHDPDLARILERAPNVLALGEQALSRTVGLFDRVERLLALQERHLELQIEALEAQRRG